MFYYIFLCLVVLWMLAAAALTAANNKGMTQEKWEMFFQNYKDGKTSYPPIAKGLCHNLQQMGGLGGFKAFVLTAEWLAWLALEPLIIAMLIFDPGEIMSVW